MKSELTACVAVLLFLFAHETQAVATPGTGSPDSPLEVDALPYILRSTTKQAASTITSYSCAPALAETGPEMLFRFVLPEAARVTAWVEEDDEVDVDVHLMDELQIDGEGRAACRARGDIIAEAEMPPGTHWISIDTFDSADNAGSFVLHLYAIGESGFSMPIAEGVEWRAWRHADLNGNPQVIHSVIADPAIPGVDMRPALPDSARTVGATAEQQVTRPVAAINASFFGLDGDYQAYNLAIADGEILSSNSFNAFEHGTIGLTAEGLALFAMRGPGGSWPEVANAQGGLPALVRNQVPTTAADWNAEGLSSTSFFGPHPRSVLGFDTAGKLFMGTFDGRRASAAGMSFAALGDYLATVWNSDSAVNLDGGGSTTLWIDGVTPNGVVNYPSDGNSEGEGATHSGSRSVFGTVLFFGNPYNHPPRFQTEAELQAAVDVLYEYDADAIDLNPGDTIAFSLSIAPNGAAIDSATGVVRLMPSALLSPQEEIVIRAEDGRGGFMEQGFTLQIDGAEGPADPDSLDAGLADEGNAQAGGCGCRSSGSAGAYGALLLALLLLVQRCRASGRYSGR